MQRGRDYGSGSAIVNEKTATSGPLMMRDLRALTPVQCNARGSLPGAAKRNLSGAR